jgi:hypothetical protein
MKATIVDLRYRMKEVLKALDRNEDVSILYHGKTKGVLTACTPPPQGKVVEHPFFNMRESDVSVEEEMDELRGGRHRAL